MFGRLSAFLAGAAVGGAGGYVMLRQDIKAASSTVTAAVATLAGRVRFGWAVVPGGVPTAVVGCRRTGHCGGGWCRLIIPLCFSLDPVVPGVSRGA